MNIVVSICCGLDVHKCSVTACLLTRGARSRPTKEVRTFETTTAKLLEMADWLASQNCQHVAMESTGVYWKPVYNILAGVCQEVLLVNSQLIKAVPGRKTDVKDAEWIAELLSYGLLRGSFVPPQEIRELRDLTRYRTTLIRQRADQSNRIQKLLEEADIKLASVNRFDLQRSNRSPLRTTPQSQATSPELSFFSFPPVPPFLATAQSCDLPSSHEKMNRSEREEGAFLWESTTVGTLPDSSKEEFGNAL